MPNETLLIARDLYYRQLRHTPEDDLMSMGAESDPPTWNPSELALQRDIWAFPEDSGPTTVLLQHPTAPFVRRLDAGNERELRAFVHSYLIEADRRADLHLPARWLDALAPDAPRRSDFGWLPIDHPSPERPPDPSTSFWFERTSDIGETIDRTLILLGAELLDDFPLGSEFGIRVVAHAQSDDLNGDEVRITSMSASLPFGPWKGSAATDDFRAKIGGKEGLFGFLTVIRPLVALNLALQEKSVIFRGFRLGKTEAGTPQFEFRGRGMSNIGRRTGLHAAPYEFIAAGMISESLEFLGFTFLTKTLLSTNAKPGQAKVFPLNPTLLGETHDIRRRRPSRRDEMLDEFRVIETISSERHAVLSIPGKLEVLKSPYVRADRQTNDTRDAASPSEGKATRSKGFTIISTLGNLWPRPKRKPKTANAIKTVDLPGEGPAIRSDDFAAVSTFHNLRHWFDRFELYRIPTEAYFRGADLPIKAIYRSGINPGPGKDGQAINACVHPEGWPPDSVGPMANPDGSRNRPILRMHLALADLSRRSRKPWDGKNPSPAIPLSVSADQNLVAHEFGHVISMASLGELELRFAHSPGDALAAIIADPFSHLVKNTNWRGETFTFVNTHRRHDRCVLHGWSWSGSLNRRAFAPAPIPLSLPPLPLAHLRAPGLRPEILKLKHKGYWTEQILSSSLFRLYRCLGGDTDQAGATEPDRHARQAASHYTVYLILKGIGILGNSLMVPANKVEQLVAALIDADVSTTTFSVPVSHEKVSHENIPKAVTRTGGCAHKVIDWAFRAQGMCPENANEINNAPGKPKTVDIYIADQRPTVENMRYGTVEHGPGSYVPVSLDWGMYTKDLALPNNAGTPKWFAKNMIRPELKDDSISVVVGNRGSQTAMNVKVKLWWLLWPKDTDPPLWEKGKWNLCNALPAQDIPPNETRRFQGFDLKPGSGRCLVLAEASCADDRSNIDPETGYPCSELPTPLPDLVGNDNNLGLIVIP